MATLIFVHIIHIIFIRQMNGNFCLIPKKKKVRKFDTNKWK